MNRIRYACLIVVLTLELGAAETRANAVLPDVGRFFYSGDGSIHLVSEKNGKSFAGRYRTGRGKYDEKALGAICRVFGAPSAPLRLIEFLDFLEDRLNQGARIVIVSGYRAPQYNAGIRKRGALAAKASLHQYGMAADLRMEGIPARRIWDYVKTLGFGGAGYYHGETVHVDVGPARSWDETTSGVGTGISDDNKLIGLVTGYDVYLPGEPMTMRFIRMTAFPIGVSPELTLARQGGRSSPEEITVFRPAFAISSSGACLRFSDINQMDAIRWRLPEHLPAGRYTVRAGFCDNPWKDMPSTVSTPEFEIVKP
jgi:Bacterial protein of unknown function (DUF882)